MNVRISSTFFEEWLYSAVAVAVFTPLTLGLLLGVSYLLPGGASVNFWSLAKELAPAIPFALLFGSAAFAAASYKPEFSRIFLSKTGLVVNDREVAFGDVLGIVYRTEARKNRYFILYLSKGEAYLFQDRKSLVDFSPIQVLKSIGAAYSSYCFRCLTKAGQASKFGTSPRV